MFGLVNAIILLFFLLLLWGIWLAYRLARRQPTPRATTQPLANQWSWHIQNQFGQTELAWYVPASTPTHRTMILLHDRRQDHRSLDALATTFHQQNYNVLLPDSLACGRSGGTYSSWGHFERTSLSQWITAVIADDPLVEIGLLGVGQGAATIGLLSDTPLPPNVKLGILEDGYTSAYASLQHRRHLPWPLAIATSLATQLLYGFTLEQVCPLRHVAHSHLPLLFLTHATGAAATRNMTQQLFQSCQGRKAEWTMGPGNQQQTQQVIQRFFTACHL